MKPNIHSKRIKGGFLHMVFFWLKNPDDQKDRRSFENVLQEFISTNPKWSVFISANLLQQIGL